MCNWKWMNLSKMAGLNISLSLKRRQSRSDKKHNLSLRLDLFYPFRCSRLFHSNFWDVFQFFLQEKRLEKNLSRWMSAKRRCRLQVPIKGWNFGAKLTHLCGFWLDVSFFSPVKKHRSRFLLNVSFFFSPVKTIVRSSDWLELICVWKFTT